MNFSNAFDRQDAIFKLAFDGQVAILKFAFDGQMAIFWKFAFDGHMAISNKQDDAGFSVDSVVLARKLRKQVTHL